METKEPKEMREQRFLEHIYEGYQAGQRYCFVLGAGAAKASGIRTGEEMMREWRDWLQEKGIDFIKDCAKELGLEEDEYIHLFEPGYTLKNDDYFTLFDLRFAGVPNVAYAYLEKEMEGKYPSYGYYPLATLLANTQNKLVITTNFDTLLEDALYTYTFRHPLVVGHESLASYIANDTRHPIIAKIHRDLLFRPLNRKQDMDKLKEEWEKPLRNVLSRYIPIVIGYAGGDYTFMSLLQDISLSGIYWCHLGNTPSEKIKATVAKHNGYLVKILGFDEIMFQIADRFSEEAQFGDPCQYLHEQAEKRCGLYQQSLEEIKERYEIRKSTAEEPPRFEADGEDAVGIVGAIERYDNRQAGGPEEISEVDKLLSEAKAKTYNGQEEEALKLYERVIALEPDHAEHYKKRSILLYKMKRYKEALQDDTKAIELSPANAIYYHSRAVTLHAMERYEEALQDRAKAIELDPSNARYYQQRGVTLHAMKRYKEALRDKTKAIELDSSNAKYYHSRAVTLHAMERYEEALQDRAKAIELEPSNAMYYQQRGITLHAMKRYEEALRDKTKAIELDPSNAEYYYGRAVTLYTMKRYKKTLLDDTKAIELDPSNAEYYRSRAKTLRKLNRENEALQDEAKAKQLESKDS